MKNAPFYLLVAVVASVIALLVFWIYLSAVGGALPENAASGLCTILFLVLAIIGFELLTKPGLYSKRRRDQAGEEKEDDEKEDESSPNT